MTLRIRLAAVAILLLAGLSGCGEELPEAVLSAARVPNAAKLSAPVLPTPTAVEELRSGKGRSVAAVGAGDLAELLEGNNAFAFDLYRALRGVAESFRAATAVLRTTIHRGWHQIVALPPPAGA